MPIIFIFIDRTPLSSNPAASGADGSPAPGSPDKLNLVGRPGEVAAELDR